MKYLISLVIGLFIASVSFAQGEVEELVSQGVELHDMGKYDEAIAKYKAALAIDSKSTLANYELSYTYETIGQFDDAIRYATIVIEQNGDNMMPAYVVLGSSFDDSGKPKKALKAYEEGLAKFPDSYLLNYNLGVTLFKEEEYEKAEKALIHAIESNPTHATSHMVLSLVKEAQGMRVQSILPIYFFLMLEPDSKRSFDNFKSLWLQLGQGVEKKDDKNINISLPSNAATGDFSPVEVFISLHAATRYTGENEDKNDMEFFAETNESIFNTLWESSKDKTGIWWDLYAYTFHDLVESGNCEAFTYYISQSIDNDIVKDWIVQNPEKMKKLQEWLDEE